MAVKIEVTGVLSGLQRKVGKKGGETIGFKFASRDLESWNRLLAFSHEDVTLTIESPQGELDLDGGEKPKRSKKEPRGRHAVEQPVPGLEA